MSALGDRIYAQTNPVVPYEQSHVWVQWKGTDVCVDIHCLCGSMGHFDGYQMYMLQCGDCGRRYAVPQTLPLIHLTDAEADAMVAEGWSFVVGAKDD